MGAGINQGWVDFANELAKMALGVGLTATVSLGLGTMLSIFNHGVMAWVKDGLLRVIGGSSIVGGAAVIAPWLAAHFKIA